MWQKGTKITLQPDWIASEPQNQWWSGLEAKHREITIEKVTPQDNNLMVEGKFSNAWDIPGWGKDWKDQKITLAVAETALDAPSITIERISGTLDVQGRPIALATEEDLLGHHRFVVNDEPQTAILLGNEDKAPKHNARLQAIAHFGQWLRTDYAVRLLDAQTGAAVHQWNAAVPDLQFGTFKSPFREVELTVVRRFRKGLRMGGDQFIAHGRIHLDQAYHARLAMASTRNVTLSVTAEEGKAFPGPAGMLEALGCETEAAQVTQALSKVPLLDTFQLEQVQVRLNLADKKLTSLGLFGTFMLLESKVHFSLEYPSLALTATLDADTPIRAGELLTAWVGSNELLPAHMKVSNLALRIGARPFRFDFSLVLSELWKFEMGDVPIEIRELGMELQSVAGQPFAGTLFGRMDLAGIDFGLWAEKEAGNTQEGEASGWQFRGEVATENPIQLDALARKLGDYFQFEVPAAFPKIALSDIGIAFHTRTKDFSLTAEAKLMEPLGPVREAELRLHLEIKKKEGDSDTQKKRQFHLRLEGTAKIEDKKAGKAWTVALNVDLGKPEWSLAGTWKADDEASGLNLLQVGTWVHQNADFKDVSPTVQQALTITEISMGYYHSELPAFVASAKTAGGQEAKLLIAKTKQGLGGVVGIGYKKPSEAPEVGQYLTIGNRPLALENAWLMFSWLPSTTDKELPAQMHNVPFPVSPAQLGKGLAFAAELDLKQNPGNAFNNLRNTTSDTRFTVLGRLSTEGLAFALKWQGELRFPTGQPGRDFVIKDVGIQLELPKLKIAAEGSLEFNLDRYRVHSKVALDLSLEEINLKLAASVPDGGIPLFDLRDVRIYKLWLLLGIGFKKGSVRLGLGGEMTFTKGQQQRDQLGVILDVIDGIPIPEYLAVDISRIDLIDLIDAFKGHDRKGANYVQQNLVGAEGLSFQWASKKLKLPDGTEVKPGTSFHGVFHIGDWKAYLGFTFYPDAGFTATGAFDPVNVEGFKFVGKGKEVTLLGTGSGTNWKPVTNTERVEPGARLTPRVVIKAGGAAIRFSSSQSPYLACTFDIQILDLFEAKADIEISKQGIKFDLVTVIKNLYSLDLKVTLESTKFFLAKGKFSAGPHVEIMWHKVGLEIFGEQEIRGGSATQFRFYWKYGYRILGLEFPGLVIDVPRAPNNFGDVVKIALDNFTENLTMVRLAKLVAQLFSGKPYDAGGGHPVAWTDTIRGRLNIGQQPDAASLATTDEEKRAALLLGDFLQNIQPVIRQESEREHQRLGELDEAFEQIHNERIARGMQTMQARIAEMKREVEDLTDANRALRDRIQAIWERHHAAYQALYIKVAHLSSIPFEDFTNERRRDQHRLNLQKHKDKMAILDNQIEVELRAIHRHRASNARGKSAQTGDIALYLYAELERIRRMGMFERQWIIEDARIKAEKMELLAHQMRMQQKLIALTQVNR